MSGKPDAPISSSVDDLLGRVPFVDEIVELAITTPREWAPRIGIYGRWGSGKTSVLNMVTERIVNAHHVAPRFNPWGFDDVDEMFDALADAVLDGIEAQGNDIKKAARNAEKVTKLVKQGAKLAGDATKNVGDFGVPGAGIVRGAFATAEYLSGALRRVFAKKKIEELRKALENLPPQTRCIVLVDDIDRAEPSLLPPLLFALHEVLVAMPITFIIALDPTVVGAALRAHHPGFGDGLAFLEKMIQFPRWLPDITDENRWQLAVGDVKQYIPDLDLDALRQEFERFPRNPRELRTLLRSMWGLNAQVRRYRDREISWNLVLRLAVLRQRHRRALDVLLEDQERLTKLIALQLAAKRRDSEQTVAVDPELEDVLRARDVDPACLPELIAALATRDLRWDGTAIIRHAHLVERPPSITRLELERLLATLPAGTTSEAIIEGVRDVLATHASSVHRSIDQVADEALSLVVAIHHELLEQSADGLFEEETIERAQTAGHMVEFAGAIVASLSSGASPDQFRRVLLAFSRWAHFDTMPEYRTLHAHEHALLLRLCHSAGDPGGYLEVMEPWDRHADRQEQAIQLRRDLERVLENAVEANLDHILERRDGVSGMLREHRSAERWCMLRRSAWSAARIARVVSLDSDAASDNALDLLRLISNAGEGARSNRYGVDARELDAMAADRAITAALWTVLSKRPLNMRFFTSVEMIKAALDQRRGEPLPEPGWWERVRALRDAANVRKQEGDDDDEPAIPPEGE